MTFKERIFHALTFELGALVVATLTMLAIGTDNAHAALGVSVAMAITAMVWNFVFNWGFDKIFTGKREDRGVAFRVFHTVSFELGLLIATVPMVAYALDLTLWQAFVADVALTLIITVYGFLFNWAFDHLRVKWWAKGEVQAV